MGKLKKLSKSDSRIHHEVEVFNYLAKDGSTIWLWACQHGCYDNAPYNKSSYEEARKLANDHASVLRDN